MANVTAKKLMRNLPKAEKAIYDDCKQYETQDPLLSLKQI